MRTHQNAPSGATLNSTTPIWRSLSEAVSTAIESYRQRAQARRDYQRLYTMSQHELDDIGLTRDMIYRAEDELNRKPFGPL